MKKTLLLAVMASSFALTGCVAPKTQWAWNGYNDHLFDYYGQSITGDEYLVFLLAAVDEAEKRNECIHIPSGKTENHPQRTTEENKGSNHHEKAYYEPEYRT